MYSVCMSMYHDEATTGAATSWHRPLALQTRAMKDRVCIINSTPDRHFTDFPIALKHVMVELPLLWVAKLLVKNKHRRQTKRAAWTEVASSGTEYE